MQNDRATNILMALLFSSIVVLAATYLNKEPAFGQVAAFGFEDSIVLKDYRSFEANGNSVDRASGLQVVKEQPFQSLKEVISFASSPVAESISVQAPSSPFERFTEFGQEPYNAAPKEVGAKAFVWVKEALNGSAQLQDIQLFYLEVVRPDDSSLFYGPFHQSLADFLKLT